MNIFDLHEYAILVNATKIYILNIFYRSFGVKNNYYFLQQSLHAQLHVDYQIDDNTIKTIFGMTAEGGTAKRTDNTTM